MRRSARGAVALKNGSGIYFFKEDQQWVFVLSVEGS